MTPGCDQPTPETEAEQRSDTPAKPEPLTKAIRDAWSHYHIYGVDALAQPVACVNELKQRVTTLIKDTQEEALAKVRAQLSLCETLYKVSQLFVAASTPTRQAMNDLNQYIGLPLEMPGFIDAVPGYPYSGIINDTSIAISKEELLRQHGLTDISDVSLGLGVIGFLIWGPYSQDPATEPRPLQDYMAKQNWDTADYELGLAELDISEHPNNRRRRYLEISVMILEEHLNQLATLWNKNTLPPLNMREAQQVKDQILTAIREQLSEPQAPNNPQLLGVLVPLFSNGDNPEDGATKLLTWLNIDNPEAFAELNHPEKPLTAKYSALATLFSVPDADANNKP